MKTIPFPTPDDRVLCENCANFRKSRVEARGTIRLRWCVAFNEHAAVRDQRLRCQRYLPAAGEADRRDGMARWPTLHLDSANGVDSTRKG